MKAWIPVRKDLAGIILCLIIGLIALFIGQILKQHTQFVSDVVLGIVFGVGCPISASGWPLVKLVAAETLVH